MFYSFPALLLFWEADLGWTKTELTFAATLAIFSSAAFSPVSGKLIDQGHGPKLLAGGALRGGIMLVILADTVVFSIS